LIGGLYFISLPSAYLFAFKLEYGLNGLYYGMGVGQTVIALLYTRLLLTSDFKKIAESVSQKLKKQ
jgi:Na+-driven multidrug efflux pump